MLSVVTYNIHFGKKLPQITRWLHAHVKEFDIICFQEFPSLEIKQFLEKIPEQFDYKFTPGFGTRRGIFGELTLVRKKIQIIETRTVTLKERSFFENTLMRTKGERTALITVLQYKKKEIIIANTHLICFALNHKRRNQINHLMKMIDNVTQNKEIPIIVLGDFNYSSLIRQKVLLNLMNRLEFENAFRSPTHRRLFLHQQLDYVFYKGCEVKDVMIEKLHFSDHYPVKVQLEV